MKQKRTPRQIHTRKLDRLVAHSNMKTAGLVSVNKKKGTGESYFSLNWRGAVTI